MAWAWWRESKLPNLSVLSSPHLWNWGVKRVICLIRLRWQNDNIFDIFGMELHIKHNSLFAVHHCNPVLGNFIPRRDHARTMSGKTSVGVSSRFIHFLSKYILAVSYISDTPAKGWATTALSNLVQRFPLGGCISHVNSVWSYSSCRNSAP